ncbi:MAG: prolyl-tRNA synthetase associated domain-containing protein [Candidatus Aminicenantes bacterium]|nr:prolyl-tRNA synthetase associated domain-containing protein [Candidatus Aminicenantes bacterium]
MEVRERKVYEALEALGIPFVKHEHPPVATVAEAVVHWQGVEGAHCKNLFVRNKPGKRHYLIIAEHRRPVDLLALSRKLGDSRLTFASDERLRRWLGLHPGEVSPFGLLADENHEVIVVLDASLRAAGKVNFHPNVNTATLTLAFGDLEKFLAWRKNRVLYVDL